MDERKYANHPRTPSSSTLKPGDNARQYRCRSTCHAVRTERGGLLKMFKNVRCAKPNGARLTITDWLAIISSGYVTYSRQAPAFGAKKQCCGSSAHETGRQLKLIPDEGRVSLAQRVSWPICCLRSALQKTSVHTHTHTHRPINCLPLVGNHFCSAPTHAPTEINE